MASYTFDSNEDMDSRRRRRRQTIAELLAEQADAKPIQSPWQGVAKMANAGISGLILGMEEKRDRELLEASTAHNSSNPVFSGGGAPASPVASALGGKPIGGPITLGGFEPTVARTLEFEGGLNPRDTNGTPSNFGINQKANPDVDVANLTPQGATEIYRKRYWDAIGADKMDPRTAHVAFDTAVIAGPGKAKELLQASGGDPEKFLALREAFQNKLLAANPEKYGPYAKAWANRTATLRSDVGVGGGGGQPGGMMAFGGQPGPAGPIQVAQAAPAGTTMNDGNARVQQLYQYAQNPMTNAVNRKIALDEIERLRKGSDPAAALAMEKARIDIEKGKRDLQKPLVDPTTTEREYALAKKEGFTGTLFDFKRELAKAGASNSSVSVTPGGGTDKQFFDTMSEDVKEARSAVTGLQAIQEARKAVAGGAIFGAGADTRLGLQKVGALLGVVDPKSIQNTETFRAAIAPQVAAMLKATVGTSQISNTDREFAQEAAGGSIKLDEGTVKRLLNIMEKAGRGRVDAFNKRLDAIYPDSPDGKYKRERAAFGLTGVPDPIPEAEAAPAGSARKSIGGKTYEKRADGWYEVK